MSKDYLEGAQADHYLKSLTPEKIFLVRGGDSFRTCGAEEWLESLLAGKDLRIFGRFKVNPDLADLEKGIEFFRDFQPGTVIAVGGGSVLDMAKMIRFFGSTGFSASGWLDGQRLAEQPAFDCPLVAVPTTAGTGSEATHFAVLYRYGVKYSVAHPGISPDRVILKPELSYAMDSYLCAATGMDALSQAVEAWWSKGSTTESRGYSATAVRSILNSLPFSLQGDRESRKNMLHAAYWAGRAINIAKTTAPHAFSYILTSVYELAHGHAVAVVLPFFMEYNLSRMAEEDAVQLRTLLGISPGAERKWTENFITSLGLDLKLKKTPDELEVLFKEHVNIERLGNNPVELAEGVFRDLAECTAEISNRA